jgi:hypothetical protein
MSSDPYVEWYEFVMTGVGAPKDAATADVMWAWSGAESIGPGAPNDGATRMRWNNPLDTTEELQAGIDIDPDVNTAGVESYPDPEGGAIATVATLLNGLYPTILANLRNSVPRAQWGNACAELGKWGTGCAWLATDYGAAPRRALTTSNPNAPRRATAAMATQNSINIFGRGTDDALWHLRYDGAPQSPTYGQWSSWQSLGGKLVSPDVIAIERNGQIDVFVIGTDGLDHIYSFNDGQTWSNFENHGGALTGPPAIAASEGSAAAILAAIAAIPTTTVDQSAVLSAIADLKAHPSFDPNDAQTLAIVMKLEAAAKAAGGALNQA